MSQITHEFLVHAGKHIFHADQRHRITVNGQTSFPHNCSTCGGSTPHARTLDSDLPVCGICGTVDECRSQET